MSRPTPLPVALLVCGLWAHALLAATCATALIASYESTLATGALLGVWAAWRALASDARPDRWGGAAVASASALSVAVALAGFGSGIGPSNARSAGYWIVWLEPRALWVGLAGIASVVLASTLPLERGVRRVALLAGGRVPPDHRHGRRAVWLSSPARVPWLRVLPPVFVGAILLVGVHGLAAWSRSLDAFRQQVDSRVEVTSADEVLTPSRMQVVWGWTSSSLSLVVRSRSDAAVLVNRHPSLVPFPPDAARNQLGDEYTWHG